MITIHIHYTGHDASARKFAEEMTASGTVDKIRAESGNLGYSYYLSLDDPETLLLIDSWRDQASIDDDADDCGSAREIRPQNEGRAVRLGRGRNPRQGRRVHPRMTLERRSAIIHENKPAAVSKRAYTVNN